MQWDDAELDPSLVKDIDTTTPLPEYVKRIGASVMDRRRDQAEFVSLWLASDNGPT
jgi:hypothetical protein